MATLIGIRDPVSGGGKNSDGLYSRAKLKAANRATNFGCTSLLLRRIRHFAAAAAASKLKIFLGICAALAAVSFFTSRIGTFMGWNPHYPSSVSSPSRGGYTVIVNTWKRYSLLKQSVAHYASCSGTNAIHVVWNERNLPSESLEAYIEKLMLSKSHADHKLYFKFDINQNDDLNNRFKPLKDLKTDAVFSVDDDVLVPCATLDFAFTVWQSAPLTMVGFVPRMHWLDQEKTGVEYYKYGGWWSVWWMGTYSMVLSKAAFFHKKYLDMYTYGLPSSIRNYVSKERNCEDIAMSLLVANASGAPPVWVKGKMHEIGSTGISSLKGHNKIRNKCLNDFISFYGAMPLVSTNFKAVDAKREWFW